MRFSSSRLHLPHSKFQQGVTLIEMLVGIIIGLLVVAVAMGALMVSRSVTGTVSDSSMLQQQASYAFRVMGQQLRQAGSLRLNLAALKAEGAAIDMSDPVAFETKAEGFDPAVNTIGGLDAPGNNEYKLTVGYRNYKEPVYTSASNASMLRDCLGQAPNDNLIQSRFVLNAATSELRCVGASGTPQPIIQNVANFQVRYLWQTDVASGTPQIRYVNAATVGTNWSQVVGVEICLVLYGNEAIDIPSDTTTTAYIDCDGTDVKLSALATLPAPRARRAHVAFRSIYQLRSQGLISAS